MSSAGDREELQQFVACLVRYASTADLDVAALLLAAFCRLTTGATYPGLDTDAVALTVPDNYYPH